MFLGLTAEDYFIANDLYETIRDGHDHDLCNSSFAFWIYLLTSETEQTLNQLEILLIGQPISLNSTTKLS
jgi:hypothetical protein